MPPPELAGDAPVGRVLKRLDHEPVLALGVEPDVPRAKLLDQGARSLVHPAPPLWRDERLDPGVAALARSDGVTVRLPLHEPVRSSNQATIRPVGGLLVEALEAFGDHQAVGPMTVSAEPAVAADLEVDRIVAGVILRAPVPNSGSTRSSAMTGTRRSTTGTSTSRPTASR